jgi:phosphatidylserine synthase
MFKVKNISLVLLCLLTFLMFSTIKVEAFRDADYEFLVSRNVVNIFASTLDFFDAKLESNEFSFRDHNL